MSIQEDKLRAIADAIRQKEGSSGLIPANDFPARILAIKSGGDFAAPLVVSVDAGATVAATLGETTVSGVSDESGSVTLILPVPGEWTVTAELDGKVKSTTVVVDDSYKATLQMHSNLPEGITLPDGYVELEYIENPNLGYITNLKNLDISHKIPFEFVLDVDPSNVNNSNLVGQSCYYSWSTPKHTSGITLYFKVSGEDVTVYLDGGGTQSSGSYVTYYPNLATITVPNTKLTIQTDFSTYLDVNGTRKTFSRGDFTYTPPDPALFAYSSTMRTGSAAATTSYLNPIACKLYSIKYGAAGHMWVPCKNPDGKPGMYHTEKEVFYPSSVADKPFIAGTPV